MIRDHMYVLAVHDLDRSAAFYRDTLGFAVHEMGDPGWRMFERDGCRIMAGACPDLVVDDADAEHSRVLATGAEIVKPLADEPWDMREFGLRTVDGHRIMIGHELRR
jgi:predicted enzyme related to lactoylglutathione lyase